MKDARCEKFSTEAANTPGRLLTTPEAADLLSISDRTLWTLTSPRGPIPCVKVGARSIRYRVCDLERYAASCVQTEGGAI